MVRAIFRACRDWFIGVVVILLAASAAQAADPLPSWNDGPTKQAILGFVAGVTKQGGPNFVAPDERIATFDNDGTLWSEQPMYLDKALDAEK